MVSDSFHSYWNAVTDGLRAHPRGFGGFQTAKKHRHCPVICVFPPWNFAEEMLQNNLIIADLEFAVNKKSLSFIFIWNSCIHSSKCQSIEKLITGPSCSAMPNALHPVKRRIESNWIESLRNVLEDPNHLHHPTQCVHDWILYGLHVLEFIRIREC